MKLSPFSTCLSIYTCLNLYYFFLVFNVNSLSIEYTNFYVENNYLEIGILQLLISSLIICFWYILFYKKKFKSLDEKGYNDFWGVSILIYQMFFFYLAFFYDVGVVGGSPSISNTFSIIFNVFNSDTFFFIVGSQLKSKKYFILNLVIYVASSLVRGWMGGVLIAIFLVLVRKGYVLLRFKWVISLSLILVGILLLLPYLLGIKESVRAGQEVSFKIDNYVEALSSSMEYLMGRFQQVAHISLIAKNHMFYQNEYEASNILPYWMEGMPQLIVNKRLENPVVQNFATKVAIYTFNAPASNAWSVNTGMAGWFSILKEKSLFFIIYWSFWVILTYSVVYRYASRQLFSLLAVFSIVYLYHGWLANYLNLLLFSMIFTLLNSAKSILSKSGIK